MKPGAGDDPFAEEERGESTDDDRTPEAEPAPEPDTSAVEPESTATDGESRTTSRDSSTGDRDIPWVLRRSSVKQSRDNVHQFFLRDEFSKREDDLMEEVADLLDMRQKDVMKLDVREAMVATADADAIAATLEEWGYEYKE